MCETCKPILECPIGEKRSVALAGFNNEATKRKMSMHLVIDKYTAKDYEIFIHTSYTDSETWQNIVVEDVLYCPKCGSKLAELKGE